MTAAVPFWNGQTNSRDQLRSLLGLPFESCEEDLQIDGERDTEKFHEIRFKFQSEKGYYVPCVLRVPAGKSAPLPVFICLQGHSTGMHISLGEPKYDGDADSIRGGDRAFAVRVVEEGFAL